jgi:2-polyprenyl-3-methyl-5-hydroxy-6-metoxy-1,4-benzoquinol methylase
MSELMSDAIHRGDARQPIRAIYTGKPDDYFSGERLDIVALLPADPAARILEVGCGSGGTGRAALAAGKAGYYAGVEIDPPSAERARTHLSLVLLGNAEEIDLSPIGDGFDALIMSEVLEHLVDPWRTLRALAERLRPGAMVYASSPNIAQRAVIGDLLRGRFRYQDHGVMDRTHLRWFTPESYAAMFREAGFDPVSIGPVGGFRPKQKLINRLTGGRFRHLFMAQIMYVGRKR